MRHHDTGEVSVDNASKRHQVERFDRIKRSPIEGHNMMRIALYRSMPGKCLPTASMPALRIPRTQALARCAMASRIAMKRAITDHAADRIADIEHRSKAQVDPVVEQFSRHHPGEDLGKLQRLRCVTVI